MNKETAKVEIAKLIDEFEKNRDYYEKTDEANIETKLIEPMFAALGWTKDDFEKREKVKRKDRRGITDYTFKLHGKSVFVLEAKKVKVEVDWDQETWKQAISYTFSKKVSFSVLTNFKNLLIFCTDDERAMNPFRQLKYTEYLSTRFEDLWLLSKDSVEQNLIIERAESEGRMKKRRTIDDELLEGLLSSRKKIVESIEQNYGDKYTTLEKDDIAQRIFGRLIFIRKCEDKQINFDKDDKEIEMLKEVTALPHNEAYPKVKKIFTKYNDAFDSGLFIKEVDSDVDRIEIDGKVIKDLIKSTYESKDGNYVYNFEWIDADILGNIYEQYLGHILKETTKQTRIKESHAHRKEQGIYYTPTDIVKYIVDNTLGVMLKEKKPDEIKKLRVLDPACGSGSFLIKAFDVLEDYYEKNREEKQLKFDSSGDFYTIKERVLVNNIFGVDLDHKAVEIAQLNLLLKLAERGHRLPLLQKNIQNGNSLIDDDAIAGNKAFKWKQRFAGIMNEGRFDVVIGNPPYVTIGGKEDANVTKEMKDYYSHYYGSYEYKANYFVLFIEKCISLLRDGGRLSFVVPRTLLDNLHMKRLRKIILDKTKIKLLVELKYHVFEEAETGGNLIFVVQKCNRGEERLNNIVNCLIASEQDSVLGEAKYNKIKQSYFLQSEIFQFFVTDVTTITLIDKIKKETKRLGETYLVNNGVNTGNAAKILLSNKKDTKLHRKILEGKDINRYLLCWNGLWINYDPLLKNRIDLKNLDTRQKRIDFSLRNEELFNSEKIILRQTADRLIGTLDNEGYITRHSTHLIRVKESGVSIKYILGVFNSKLLSYYYRNLIPEKGKVFAEVKAVNVEKLPIKFVPKYAQQPVIDLVEKILSLNKHLNEIGDKSTPETARLREEIKRTDAEIDELVYKLYGITEEEKKIIEESLK